MYQARRPSRSEFIPIRHLDYHVRVWGEPSPDRPPLVLVHGWMDVAASWQFMVDAMGEDRHIIAPDWRGFGLTRGPATDNYWFPDYLADLDALLDHYAADQPIDLVGHSMGGNVVMVYAGVRPQRIRRLVNLEGFGMPATRPAQAPGRYAQWLDELKALRRGDMDLKAYDSLDGVARRLMKTNPRLTEDKARWLAGEWAQPDDQGHWRILGDPAHKVVNAQLYRLDEVQEVFARITAPLLSVTASDDSLGQWWKGRYTLEEYRQRLKVVTDLREAHLDDAGHMLHHDQPQALARLIETFLA
ncbi:alpha/beta fold hydrolase [Hydrogenophaga sp.]|uniref:alpha/beta fold hydrolase n=1 Tax=Hydrogenophaga sp. TaxID=1904254 RepID=UPI0035B082B6